MLTASALSAVAAPKAIGSSNRINELFLPEDPEPEEVRISNIRVIKDVITTISRGNSPFRWEPTSISIDISWDGHAGSCTCYRPTRGPTTRKDTCVSAEKQIKFRFNMERIFNDGTPTAKLYLREGFNEIGIFLDFRIKESDCQKTRWQWRKVRSNN